MAMGIVSNSDFDSELKDLGIIEDNPEGCGRNNDVNPNDAEVGRGNGNVEVPNSLRKLIGETSIVESRTSALELAKSFGISESSVGAYSNGSTSTSSYKEKPNGKIIKNAKAKISKHARSKLMLALHHITEEKIAAAKVRDIAGIAKDMSTIVKNMEDAPVQEKSSNGPNITIYSPQFRKEETFSTIQVKE